MFGRKLQASHREPYRTAQHAAAGRPPSRRKALFETLEQRLLLSADPLAAAAQISLPLVGAPADISTASEQDLRAADLSLQSGSSWLAAQGQVDEAHALAFPPVELDQVASGDVVTHPAPSFSLPGLQLVSDDVSPIAGQVFYLDVDGEDDVLYDGAVRVEGIDVPEYQAPAPWTGKESSVVDSVLAESELDVRRLWR